MLYKSIAILIGLVFSSQVLAGQNTQSKSIRNDNKLHIYFCGTGKPTSTPKPNQSAIIRKPSCLAFIAQDDFFTIDAGAGAILTLASLRLPLGDISRVFMTHWHSDHFAGLGQIMNVSWYSGRKKLLDIYGPYGIDMVVDGIEKAYRLDNLYRSINQTFDPNTEFFKKHLVDTFYKDQSVYSNKDLAITAFTVDHAPAYPAMGYVVRYKGCKIVVSGDTKVMPNLEKHAKNADVLINEAVNVKMYLAWDKGGNRTPEQLAPIVKYHSDTLEIAKMAKKEGVKHVYLTHLLPSISNSSADKKAFVAGMSAYYRGPVTVMDDRDELVVSSENGICRVDYIPAKPLK